VGAGLCAARRGHAGIGIRELLKLLEQPDIISFAGGIPDPAVFPAQEAASAYAEALSGDATAATALQYSVSEGYRPLREWIADYMASRGVPASSENIVITAGSQQALDFLGKLMLTPGDTALVTAPTYLGALQAFAAYEPRYDTIRPEQTNRTPSSYRDAAQKAAPGARVKFAYVVPDFANPTGETLSWRARTTLLDLAGTPDIPVIEDTAYQHCASRAQTFRRFKPSTWRGAALSTNRGSSISAHFRRRSLRDCGSAGSVRRKHLSGASC